MDDDDDVQHVRRQSVIHYGSLADNAGGGGGVKRKAAKDDDDEDEDGDNVQRSTEYLALEKEDMVGLGKEEMLQEFERRKRARLINVSTDDAEVKKNLRDLGEPICLFGEGPADRRNRLRELFSQLGEDAVRRKRAEDEEREREAREHDETTWYHEGPDGLQRAREAIAQFSLPRARARIARAKEEASRMTESAKMAKNQEVTRKVKATDLQASQIADQRPVSWCSFAPDSRHLATGSWSGLCKIWAVPECREVRTLRGHIANVGSVVFNPSNKSLGDDPRANALASCAQDGSVKLWDMESDLPIANLEGHDERVARCAYHPSGRFLGTCVYDNSWRLWDVETTEEVLHQEGHSKPVHCIAFQNDGALAVTGGMDSFGRVWDLRTGQCIMFLEGHLKGVIAADWSPDGYHVVTGSLDNSCKIWDLRKRNIEYTVPGHTNVVSNVVFEKAQGGEYLVTSSYDGTAKIWTAPTWQPLLTLKGHDARLMGCDVAPDGSLIATCSFDRTFKLWSSSEL